MSSCFQINTNKIFVLNRRHLGKKQESFPKKDATEQLQNHWGTEIVVAIPPCSQELPYMSDTSTASLSTNGYVRTSAQTPAQRDLTKL